MPRRKPSSKGQVAYARARRRALVMALRDREPEVIARVVGYSMDTVDRWMQAPPSEKLEARHELIVEKLKAGRLSVEAIAAEAGVTARQVYEISVETGAGESTAQAWLSSPLEPEMAPMRPFPRRRPSEEPRTPPRLLLHWSCERFEQGDVDGALELVSQVLDDDVSERIRALAWLHRACFELGDERSADAVESLKAARKAAVELVRQTGRS